MVPPEVRISESRQRLLPGVVEHAERLIASFGRIDRRHRAAGEELVDWVGAHDKPGQPLHVLVVCTGNSRRSILGATMGNIAAAYCGRPEVRFHSGSTAPSAFNSRPIAALRAIGVQVEPTGAEAPRGDPATANPIYRVRWGRPRNPGEPVLEATEFSKPYDDPINPQEGFAALMVCDEADAGCRTVRGACLRLSVPVADPKAFDDRPEEAAQYAARRDDLGRLLLWVMTPAQALKLR